MALAYIDTRTKTVFTSHKNITNYLNIGWYKVTVSVSLAPELSVQTFRHD